MSPDRNERSLPGIAFVDFLANMLLVFLCLFVLALAVISPKSTPPTIETLGYYAIELDWADGLDDDIDLWVRDPNGYIVYFASPDVALMHLEHDDLGTINDTVVFGTKKIVSRKNHERVILRGTMAGEYTVNVMMYNKIGSGPVDAKVKLYRLKGPDAELLSAHLLLSYNGQDKTAFRFTLNGKGDMTGSSDLQRRIGQWFGSQPVTGYGSSHTQVPQQ